MELNSNFKNSLRNNLFKFWDSNKQYFEFSKSLNLDFYDGAHPFHVEIIGLIKDNALVLDIACGSAEIGKVICRKAHYVGIDVSEVALKMSKETKQQNMEVVKGDVAHLPFKDNIFDNVFSTFSMEHFVYPEETLLEAKRVLKKNGSLVLLSEAYDNPLFSPPSINFGMLAKMKFKEKIKSGHYIEFLRYFLRRLKYVFKETTKQFLLFFNKRHFPFEIVKQPRVLNEDFSQDKDVVYIVSIREVINFLLHIGFTIEKVNYNKNSRFGISRYFTTPLFIVAKKI